MVENVELLNIKSEDEYSSIRRIFKKIGNAIISFSFDPEIYEGELLQIKDGKSKTNNALYSEKAYSDLVMKSFLYKRCLFGLYARDIVTNKMIPIMSDKKFSRLRRHTFVRNSASRKYKGKVLCTELDIRNAINNTKNSANLKRFIDNDDNCKNILLKYNMSDIKEFNNLNAKQKIDIINTIRKSYIDYRLNSYSSEYQKAISENCIKKEINNFNNKVSNKELNNICKELYNGDISREEADKRIDNLKKNTDIQKEYITDVYKDMPKDLLMHRFYKIGKKDVTIKARIVNIIEKKLKSFKDNSLYFINDIHRLKENKHVLFSESEYNDIKKDLNNYEPNMNKKINNEKTSSIMNEQSKQEMPVKEQKQNKNTGKHYEQVKNDEKMNDAAQQKGSINEEKVELNKDENQTKEEQLKQEEKPKQNNNQQKYKKPKRNIVIPTKEDINNYWNQKMINSTKKRIIVSSYNNDVLKLIDNMVSLANHFDMIAVSHIDGVPLSTEVLNTKGELLEYYMCKRYGYRPQSVNVQMVLMTEKGKITKQKVR